MICKSKFQTKEWRKKQNWYINGKKNECEKFQILHIENIINCILYKTNDRIYKENNSIRCIKNIYHLDNAFEFSENFDGKIIKDNIVYYFNLKFVCNYGGAQNRTLRNVYDFIKEQINFVKKNNIGFCFINILDGDFCFNNMNKFKYILNKDLISNIFIGDLYEFEKYWANLKSIQNISCQIIN